MTPQEHLDIIRALLKTVMAKFEQLLPLVGLTDEYKALIQQNLQDSFHFNWYIYGEGNEPVPEDDRIIDYLARYAGYFRSEAIGSIIGSRDLIFYNIPLNEQNQKLLDE